MSDKRLLVLMYTLDPRGRKVGGIETHIRLILSRHAADFDLLFIGIDERGDCRPGKPIEIEVGTRRITFLPVAQVPGETVNRAAKKLTQSTTLAYVLGCLKALPTIRRLTRGRLATADLHRFEFALLPRLLGLKAVQMVHGEGTRKDAMDSLIKRYWFIHAANEAIALRSAAHVLCVNTSILKRLEREFPRAARKAEVMSVPVDTEVFRPSPFDTRDGVMRIVFAGRLDAFKDPALIFRTLARLKASRDGKVEFHYIGASDPERFPEFAEVADITIRHGFLDAAGVSRVISRCHMGLMASFFEGMPCFLLETLASGRPFVSIRLPQYDPLIRDGLSGRLVERAVTPEASAAALAEACGNVFAAAAEGRLAPQAIAAIAAPFAVEAEMARLFAIHRTLGGPGRAEAQPRGGMEFAGGTPQ